MGSEFEHTCNVFQLKTKFQHRVCFKLLDFYISTSFTERFEKVILQVLHCDCKRRDLYDVTMNALPAQIRLLANLDCIQIDFG